LAERKTLAREKSVVLAVVDRAAVEPHAEDAEAIFPVETSWAV
jgi:hypothetical protein